MLIDELNQKPNHPLFNKLHLQIMNNEHCMLIDELNNQTPNTKPSAVQKTTP